MHREINGPRQVDASVGIFLVVAVRLYREGLEQFLRREEGFELIGTCGSLESALPGMRARGPDVLLLDLGVSRDWAAVRAVRAASPGTKLIALAIQETEAEVIAWAKAGMAGYASRDASLTDVAATIRRAARGELHCPPRIVAGLAAHLSRTNGQRDIPVRTGHLTSRESDIVELIERGLSNKEIARELSIALPTVKNHVHNILGKLNAQHRFDAVSIARRSPEAT